MIASYIISSVITAANSVDLTTLEVVKDDLEIKGGADDAYLRRVIRRSSVSAANYCNRVFGLASYEDLFRLDRGYQLGRFINGARNPLMLVNWPLVAVGSIVVGVGADAVTLETTDFEVDAKKGFIFRLNTAGNPRDWPATLVTVPYTAGYVLPNDPGTTTLPEDISDAVGRMVSARWNRRRTDPMVQEKTIFGVSSTRFFSGKGEMGNMPQDVEDILSNYRVPVTA